MFPLFGKEGSKKGHQVVSRRTENLETLVVSDHQWRKELAEHGAFPGSGRQTALEENRRFKRELEQRR